MTYDPRTDPTYNKDKIFMSLLRRESSFNPNAVSPVGARGYAQIMKGTALNPGLGLKGNPAALTDPQQNVKFGLDYFNALKSRYKGDASAALVGYNGGPGVADKWVASGKNDKVIPAETRAYYKDILSKADQPLPKVKIPEDSSYEPQFTKSMKKVAVKLDDDGKIKIGSSDGTTDAKVEETDDSGSDRSDTQSDSIASSSSNSLGRSSSTDDEPTLEDFSGVRANTGRVSLNPYQLTAPKLRLATAPMLQDNPMDR